MANEAALSQTKQSFDAPHPGSQQMPQWHTGELIDAPVFTWRNWFALLGPGLLLGGASIGGGEWLMGPAVTARYGGALMWLATLSILGQVIYNIEISRYTLYCGEPIFTGKFRTLPGPMFWVFIYILLDFGSFFPYLASSAATPVAAVMLGHIPNPDEIATISFAGSTVELLGKDLIRYLGEAIFLLSMVPLILGGKIYNTLRLLMTFKIVTVLGFLLFLAICFSTWQTWSEIFGGFVRFGTVPVQRGEDANGNGVLDPGEDWDGDGHLDVVESDTDASGEARLETFVDQDGDGIRDGDNVENVFSSLLSGRGLPDVDFSTIAMLAAFASIAGSGGLTNAPISNYTRDQGWGMGYHVGAIPSIVGGRNISLSHEGTVFDPTSDSLPRWRRWYKHVCRDQLAVWMPACFLGVALPSMLSVQFLRKGTIASEWTAAGMTADGVSQHVASVWGSPAGNVIWYLTLLCGFLVLGCTVSTTADGIVRRWVDTFWTSVPAVRTLDPRNIKYVYFGILLIYMIGGVITLWNNKPLGLVTIATMIYNFALGISCWHVLAVNLILLPKALRPGWFIRCAMVLSGAYFTVLATLAAIQKGPELAAIWTGVRSWLSLGN
jgi:hypothetical protein